MYVASLSKYVSLIRGCTPQFEKDISYALDTENTFAKKKNPIFSLYLKRHIFHVVDA